MGRHKAGPYSGPIRGSLVGATVGAGLVPAHRNIS